VLHRNIDVNLPREAPETILSRVFADDLLPPACFAALTDRNSGTSPSWRMEQAQVLSRGQHDDLAAQLLTNVFGVGCLDRRWFSHSSSASTAQPTARGPSFMGAGNNPCCIQE
jgi:hypothetical protein